MSKFNKTNLMKTTNRCNYPAYSMSDKEHLVTAVLTTMFGESKFYGDTDAEVVKLATACAQSNPEFLYKLTYYARNVANLRSVSHVLVSIIAHEANEYTRRVIANTVVRADDILEIMACYKAMYGKPFPNALKREIANQMNKFNAYQIGKYNGGDKEIKFKDVLRIVHPRPTTKQQEKLFSDIINDTVETPYTWETELSAKGNTKKVWNELISSGKVGYMALLRNLKNIINSGADIEPVLNVIADPEQVKNSKQLPFRFYSAYNRLKQEGVADKRVYDALETALTSSIDNMEQIPGRTLIAVDVSGSMTDFISEHSTVRCSDIASLLGAMSARLCEDATVCYFDSAGSWPRLYSKGYTIKKYGKYDGILNIVRNTPFTGGGTNMHLPLEYALTEDIGTKPFDRVIYFSDNECNSTRLGAGRLRACQSEAEEYRRKFNPNFWVHGVDLKGYGTQQFIGDKFNLIAGWSETVLPFINLAEQGINTLVKEIENIEC